MYYYYLIFFWPLLWLFKKGSRLEGPSVFLYSEAKLLETDLGKVLPFVFSHLNQFKFKIVHLGALWQDS